MRHRVMRVLVLVVAAVVAVGVVLTPAGAARSRPRIVDFGQEGITASCEIVAWADVADVNTNMAMKFVFTWNDGSQGGNVERYVPIEQRGTAHVSTSVTIASGQTVTDTSYVLLGGRQLNRMYDNEIVSTTERCP